MTKVFSHRVKGWSHRGGRWNNVWNLGCQEYEILDLTKRHCQYWQCEELLNDCLLFWAGIPCQEQGWSIGLALDVVWLNRQVGRFKDVLSSACAEDASKLKSKSAGLPFDSQTGTPTFLLFLFVRYVSFVFWILKLCFGIWTMIVPVLTPLQEVTLMSWVLINDKFFWCWVRVEWTLELK